MGDGFADAREPLGMPAKALTFAELGVAVLCVLDPVCGI